MGKRGRQLTKEEAIRLVEFYQLSEEGVAEFSEKHGISKAHLYRLIKKYGGQHTEKSLSEEDHIRREKELQAEILKLRIENERLKKNYTVRTTEDGRTEYIRLRERNTES